MLTPVQLASDVGCIGASAPPSAESPFVFFGCSWSKRSLTHGLLRALAYLGFCFRLGEPVCTSKESVLSLQLSRLHAEATLPAKNSPSFPLFDLAQALAIHGILESSRPANPPSLSLSLSIISMRPALLLVNLASHTGFLTQLPPCYDAVGNTMERGAWKLGGGRFHCCGCGWRHGYRCTRARGVCNMAQSVL